MVALIKISMVDEATSPLILDMFIDLLNVGCEKWGRR